MIESSLEISMLTQLKFALIYKSSFFACVYRSGIERVTTSSLLITLELIYPHIMGR